MGIKKFITTVTEHLGLEIMESTTKKKSVKSLLKKLNVQKNDIKKSLDKKSLDKKKRKELEEDYKIVTLQIKKGEKILQKLTSKQIKESYGCKESKFIYKKSDITKQ